MIYNVKPMRSRLPYEAVKCHVLVISVEVSVCTASVNKDPFTEGSEYPWNAPALMINENTIEL